MKYTIYREPFTHIVIDDWLPWVYNLQILNELAALVPYMRDSKVNSDQGLKVAASVKSSKNLWMFQHDARTKCDYKISTVFEKHIWSSEVKNILKETNDSLFQTMMYTDTSQLLLSRYENGDHYDWHRDYNPTCTMNYMLAREPLKFSGGDFVLGSWDDKTEQHKIEFKNNRLVIFPSRCFHKVETVTGFKGSPDNARFTLQYWSKLKELREN